MTLPKHRVTFAQNREDLMLDGILRTVSVGFYVDVGANHPDMDSVTKLFYEKGWSGINVEPNERLFIGVVKKNGVADCGRIVAFALKVGFEVL